MSFIHPGRARQLKVFMGPALESRTSNKPIRLAQLDELLSVPVTGQFFVIAIYPQIPRLQLFTPTPCTPVTVQRAQCGIIFRPI